MTKEYVQMVGRMAYMWGWPLINNAHRHAAFSKALEPGLMGGVLPVVHNSLYSGVARGVDSTHSTFVRFNAQKQMFLDHTDSRKNVRMESGS